MAVRNYPGRILCDLQHCQIGDVKLTGLVVGRGAHTEVLEARLPGGVCAVKKRHCVQEKLLLNRREDYRECKLMSRLCHPHIIQFLGVCELPDSFVPGLVTELMLIDLQSMLLSGSAKVHFSPEIKHSILLDVSHGLAFLHSQRPPIIHCNLTADNILLNSTVVAKIAGFGSASKMSKSTGSHLFLTSEEKAERYNEPVDIFSFGILCLFTLIQTYPWPFTTGSTEDPRPFTMESTEDPRPFIMESTEDPRPFTMESTEDPWLITMESTEDLWPFTMESTEDPWSFTMESTEDPWLITMESTEDLWPFTMESTEDPRPFTMESTEDLLIMEPTEDKSSFDPDTYEILFSQSREADKQLDVIQRAQAVMGWLVQDIQKCLQSNSELRPTARCMLSVLESEWNETVEKRMEMSKPEFVQIMHKNAFQKRLFMVSLPSACMYSKGYCTELVKKVDVMLFSCAMCHGTERINKRSFF